MIYIISIYNLKIFFLITNNRNNNIEKCLIGVSKTTHTTHDAEYVVVSGVDTDLGGLDTTNGGSRDDELKSSVVDSGEVACAGRLVLLRAQGE